MDGVAHLKARNTKVTETALSHRQRHIANAHEWARRALLPVQPEGADPAAMMDAAHREMSMAGGLQFANQRKG